MYIYKNHIRGCNVAEKGRREVADPEYGTSVKYSSSFVNIIIH